MAFWRSLGTHWDPVASSSEWKCNSFVRAPLLHLPARNYAAAAERDQPLSQWAEDDGFIIGHDEPKVILKQS